ncbi:hypothetical protein DITRI_Ditri08aG0100000 [Diplodiscus trichospermus]
MTEDYLNIMLDEKQNHLLQMGVMLRSNPTLVISASIACIFGMNIHIELIGMAEFLWTIGGGTTGHWDDIRQCDCYCMVQVEALVSAVETNIF